MWDRGNYRGVSLGQRKRGFVWDRGNYRGVSLGQRKRGFVWDRVIRGVSEVNENYYLLIVFFNPFDV